MDFDPDLHLPVGTVVPAQTLRMPYVFGPAFYTEDTTKMGPFETLLYTAITTRRVPDVGQFVTSYLRQWRSLTKDQLFYRIPLYIWLTDMACDNLARVTV